jgi:oligoendopeptidase F
MNLLPFDSLPAHKPRRFVPEQTDLGDWAQMAPLFDQLQFRAGECKSLSELEQWVLDWGELSAALDEESSKRYIAMTCHTDNPQAEKAYLHFVEKIDPELKPRQFELEKIYVKRKDELQKSPARPESNGRYLVFDRDVKNHIELFRPENVPLETEEAKLSQNYQKLSGSLTVIFRGEERTLVQMGRYLEETDRTLRKEAWEVVANRRLLESEKFEEIFDKQIKLRQQIAKHAGFENYRDYAFRRLGRFDYTPEDCVKFHDAVANEIMPVVRELQAERRKKMNLETLRPWDLAVDPLNRPPLKPFQEVGEMVSRTQNVFNHLDRDLADGFQRMQNLRLLDLANRKGKAPGGYQATLAEARVPFIFMNAVGSVSYKHHRAHETCADLVCRLVL